MATLKKGDRIPDFELYDQHGKLFRLKEQLGEKNVVIYFYPKADTPGCTNEACSFRDSFEDLLKYNCKVVGISSDDIDTQKAFAEKYGLPFTLLSDPENKVRNKFDVPRSLLGILPGRVTFVADKKGVVQYVFNSQFRTSQHVKEAINVLKKIEDDRN